MRKLRGISANLGLAALVVLDVPLLIAAVHHGEGSSAAARLPAAEMQVAETPTAGPADAAAGPPSTRGAGHAVMLSFSSAASGWRATPGCARPAHLAATTDGGRSWHSLVAPAPHVLRIVQSAAATGWLVGADDRCTPAFYSTADGGKTWAAGAGLGQAWVDLGRALRLPNGTITKPCGKGSKVGSVSPASVSIALIRCGSGLLATTDGGLRWVPAGTFPQGGRPVAVALMAASSGRGVALLAGATGCAGLAAVSTQDAGAHWASGTCLSTMHAPAAVTVTAGGAGYAVAGHRSARTTDGGQTWT